MLKPFAFLRSRYSWIAIFATFCLIALILEIRNATPKCGWAYKGVGVYGTAGCEAFPDQLCTAAFISTRQMEMNWNGKPYYAEETRVCPWRTTTSVFNYISLGISTIFILLFMRTIKNVNLKYTLITGILALIFTSVSIALMANDVKSGADKIVELKKIYKSFNFEFTQTEYIVNIIFSGLTFLVVLAFVVRSFRKRHYVDKQEQGQKPSGKNQQATPQLHFPKIIFEV